MLYQEFIQDIINTRGQWNIPEGEYYEKHHIIPKCMGGSNDKENIIYLYAREHFIAHKLLAEENPKNYKINSAYWRMVVNKSDKYGTKYICTPEEYEEAKILRSELLRKRMTGLTGEKSYAWGWKHTEETKKKMSEAHKGRKNSPEHNKHISEAKMGSKNPMYHIGNLHPFYGKHHTEESKKKMSDNRKGKLVGKDNPESKAVMCVETGEVFESMSLAAKSKGICNNIARACKDGKRCGGYHWKWV